MSPQLQALILHLAKSHNVTIIEVESPSKEPTTPEPKPANSTNSEPAAQPNSDADATKPVTNAADALIGIGVAPATANALAEKIPEERIRDAVNHYYAMKKAGRANGPGFVVNMLRRGWRIPTYGTSQEARQ